MARGWSPSTASRVAAVCRRSWKGWCPIPARVKRITESRDEHEIINRDSFALASENRHTLCGTGWQSFPSLLSLVFREGAQRQVWYGDSSSTLFGLRFHKME